MQADLVLPGSIPGLLRRGSPVVAERVDGRPSDEPLRGVVVGPFEDDLDIAWADYFPHPSGIQSRGRSIGDVVGVVRLDLTDATGRAHAAWWLDEHPALRRDEGYRCLRGARWLPCAAHVLHHGPSWRLISDADMSTTTFGFKRWIDVDLRELNHDDSRALPDGSRWVDAEALRRVVLHVAGLEVTLG